jgi:heptose I phosphotransferase
MKEGFWHRLFRGVRRLRQQSHWEEFAGPGWADRIMGLTLTDRFHAKQGRTIVRWTLGTIPRPLVVYLKRHYRLPWWHGLLALLCPNRSWSPAMQEWEHLEWARAQGLPVPRAAAAGEFIGPWGRLQSFLAVEELTGMLALHEAIPLAASRLCPDAFRRWKRGLMMEIVALTLALHRQRRFHKDLYLCHFYVAEEDTAGVPESWDGRLRMIDLHRLAHHPRTWLWWRAKDLAQLFYSSHIPGITARDRLGFWRAYVDSDQLGRMSGALRLVIRFKAWNNRRRDRGKRLKRTQQAHNNPSHRGAA